MEKTLIINRKEAEMVLNYPDCIKAMENIFAAMSDGKVTNLQRTMIRHEGGCSLAIMPASDNSINVTGGKVIMFASPEAARNKTNQGIVPLFDTITGALKAIVDAELITVNRTAASSAAAANHLAKKDASVLAIFGGGKQGRAHALAVAAIRDIKKINVWSYHEETIQACCEYLKEKLPDVEIVGCPDGADAAKDADIICTTTSAKTNVPILKGEWVKKGACICAIGACSGANRECDEDLVLKAKVFSDMTAAVLRDGGDVAIPIAEGKITESHIICEIGDVIAGRNPGRTSDDDITLFKSVGISAEDVAASWLIYEKAKEQGLGTWVEI
ncbi:MAG: ornithine cyclodeaminase family protein [Clostridia bacterium]|nr:ornithine cyclodeaminase family protein [Clostridia bacterium]